MWIPGVVQTIESQWLRGTTMNTVGNVQLLPTVVATGMRIDLILRSNVRGSVVSSKAKVISPISFPINLSFRFTAHLNLTWYYDGKEKVRICFCFWLYRT